MGSTEYLPRDRDRNTDTDIFIGDELSMLIATATVLHRVFTFDKSLTVTITSGLVTSLLMTLFITWHCIVDEAIMHSVLFGIMIFVVGVKTRMIIGARVKNKEVRAEVRKLATWGSGKLFLLL